MACSAKFRTVAAGFVLAMIATATTSAWAETTVRLTNGYVLRGNVQQIIGLNKNAFAAAAAGSDATGFPVVMVDDGLKRTFVYNRGMVAGTSDAADLILRIPLWQSVARGNNQLAALGINTRATPFNEDGRRWVRTATPGGMIEVLQGITEINARYAQAQGLQTEVSYSWDMRLATDSIPAQTFRRIFKQAIDRNDLDGRLEVVNFYIESERFGDARRELKAVIQDFPAADQLPDQLQALTQREARQILDEAIVRRDAGQYQLALDMLQNFTRVDGIARVTRLEAQDRIDELIAERDKAETLLAQLEAQIQQLPAGQQDNLLEFAKLMRQEMSFDTLSRLSDYERLGSEDRIPLENRIALALGGWLQGAGSGMQNLAIVRSLIDVRSLVSRYLATDQALERGQILAQLEGMEAARPEYVAKLLPTLPPPIPLSVDPANQPGLGQPMAERPVPAEPSTPDQFGPEQIGPEQIGPEQIGPEQIGPEQSRPEQLPPENQPAATSGDFGRLRLDENAPGTTRRVLAQVGSNADAKGPESDVPAAGLPGGDRPTSAATDDTNAALEGDNAPAGDMPLEDDTELEQNALADPQNADLADPDDSSPPGFYQFTIETERGPVEYCLQLPPEYHPLRKYPTIVALHPLDTLPEAEIQWWAGRYDPQLGMRGGQASRRGFIVVAPRWTREGQSKYEFTPQEHHRVMAALRDAMRKTSIDSDRVFLTGHLAGATAAWDIALAHPDLWSGLVCIGGQADKYILFYGTNGKYVPMYFVSGDMAATSSLLQNGAELDDYMKPGYDVMVTLYRGHGDSYFYEDINNIFDWMQLSSHRRPSIPREIETETMRPGDQFFWWLELPQLLDSVAINPVLFDFEERRRAGQISARVSDNNLIRIAQAPAQNYRVLLTPEMGIDLYQGVSIRAGSRTYTHEFDGSLEFMLEDARRRADRQHVYWDVAQIP